MFTNSDAKWLDGVLLGPKDLVVVVSSVYKAGLERNVRPILEKTSMKQSKIKNSSNVLLTKLKEQALKFRWPRTHVRPCANTDDLLVL